MPFFFLSPPRVSVFDSEHSAFGFGCRPSAARSRWEIQANQRHVREPVKRIQVAQIRSAADADESSLTNVNLLSSGSDFEQRVGR
jgi:hypothetical protein